jgi:hypothetical protein
VAGAIGQQAFAGSVMSSIPLAPATRRRISFRQAADLYEVDVSTFRKLVKKGVVPQPRRYGAAGRLWFYSDELHAAHQEFVASSAPEQRLPAAQIAKLIECILSAAPSARLREWAKVILANGEPCEPVSGQ